MPRINRYVIVLSVACALAACQRDRGNTPDKPVFGDAAAAPHSLLYVADVSADPAAGFTPDLSDEDITARVQSALDADPTLSDSQIKVRTQNRIVSLSGAVDSESEVRRAAAITLAVHGVAGVENRLNLMVSN